MTCAIIVVNGQLVSCSHGQHTDNTWITHATHTLHQPLTNLIEIDHAVVVTIKLFEGPAKVAGERRGTVVDDSAHLHELILVEGSTAILIERVKHEL